MKKLYIDFAPASWYRRLYHISPLAWLLLIGALVWLATLLLQHAQLQQKVLEQSAQLERDQARLAAREQVKPPVVQSTINPQQAKAVNQAVQQLNLPWRDLLSSMEQVTTKDIALLTLEPDAKSHILRVQAESKSSKEMADYLKKLRHVGLFDSVVLNRHEINEQDPNRPLRFQFEAHWQVEGEALSTSASTSTNPSLSASGSSAEAEASSAAQKGQP